MSLAPAVLIYTKAQVPGVSNRVYARDSAPAETTAPYIVFGLPISKNFSHSLGSDSGYCTTRVQFSVFSLTKQAGGEVIEELRAAYRNFRQANSENKMGNAEWVQCTLLENEIDLGKDEKTGLYQCVLDIFFKHIES